MLNLELERIERRIRALPVEHAYALSTNYRILFHATDGAPNRVGFSPGQIAKLENAIVTHNHPGGRSFSPADVFLALNLGLAELRVVTARHRFSLKPPEGGWGSLDRSGFAHAVAAERDLLRWELFRDIERGAAAARDVELTLHHQLWVRIADRGLITYGRETW